MFKVYLAGPIKGQSFIQSDEWRQYALGKLRPPIVGYSPLRAKAELLSDLTVIDNETHRVAHPLTTDGGILSRDHNDVMTCDLLLVNLLGATQVSIGTVSEIAWGYAYRKQIVVVMENEGNVHSHLFIREQARYIVPTLDEAIAITHAILLPD